MEAYRRLLRNRPFRYLYLGLLISRLGDGMASLIITWTVWEQTASPALVALSVAMTVLPPILFGFASGVVADRFPHRTVMALCDIGRMAVAGGAAALAWTGLLLPWHLMVAALLIGIMTTFFNPARAAALPHLVGPEQVQAANGLMSGSFHGAVLLGPLLGGWLLEPVGAGTLLFVDALTFTASLVGILLLPVTRTAVPAERQPVLTEVREGVAVVSRTRSLTWVLGTFGIGTFLAGGVVQVGRTMLMDQTGGGAAGLGMMSTLMGAGIVLGSLAAGRVRTGHRSRLVMAAWALDGLMLALMGLSGRLWAILGLAFGSGLVTAFINVPTESLIQLHGGRHVGKVFSFWHILIWLGELISLAVFAPVLGRLPVGTVFALSGVALALVGLLGFRRAWTLADGAPATVPTQAVS